MDKTFDQLTMNETAAHYERKMAALWEENEKLKKENTGLKGKNRGFRRSINRLKAELAELKKDQHKKPFYRNGRRGTNFNG